MRKGIRRKIASCLAAVMALQCADIALAEETVEEIKNAAVEIVSDAGESLAEKIEEIDEYISENEDGENLLLRCH